MNAQMFQTVGRTMQPGEHMHIRCLTCGHQVALSRTQAIEKFGERATPAQVRSKLVCGEPRCGSRKVTVWI